METWPSDKIHPHQQFSNTEIQADFKMGKQKKEDWSSTENRCSKIFKKKKREEVQRYRQFQMVVSKFSKLTVNFFSDFS